MEQAELQQLPKSPHHSHPDELSHIDAGVHDALRVCAPHTIHPLHHDHLVSAVLLEQLGNVHVGVVQIVLIKFHLVAAFLAVIQLLEQLYGKLVQHQLRVCAKAFDGPAVDKAGEEAEDVEVTVYDGLDAWSLHFDCHVRTIGTQHPSVHLSKGSGGDGDFREGAEDGIDGLAHRLFNDAPGLLSGEGRHVVLQDHQLIHVVRPHQVWPVGQHLASLDIARA
mmetsp:Transcript_40763/g.68283  ORF Transcript_40763/g.68283 Transcript_40763/m.68283 type:complete len:222 (-) Transcript_40763:719-1384(-)